MCVCGDVYGVHPRTLDGLWITRAHLNVTRVDVLFVATYKGTESSTIVQFRSGESEKKTPGISLYPYATSPVRAGIMEKTYTNGPIHSSPNSKHEITIRH